MPIIAALCLGFIGYLVWSDSRKQPDVAEGPSSQEQNQLPRLGPKAGEKAPDISGEDVDGKEFKLSDYRGKVVVLDFWGFW